ncbi:hypothetical protein CHS0354_020901 [Potamilus streckersoni]|uniref:Ubiquitin-like protein 5 n=1 Tax=Potamilus streckersoni TaxID=2493646 RepID=A0AAE0SVB1_9BIVA|nr:hypothetical protein CHS0354_020901 [Potamilus streckersoni]
MIEITCNDRLGKKVRVKCNPDDTIGDMKKLIAAQTGTRSDKIVLKKCCTTSEMGTWMELVLGAVLVVKRFSPYSCMLQRPFLGPRNL